MVIFTNKDFNSYELKVSPPNRDLVYSRPRSRSGREILSHMNAFSRQSEIIFSREADTKKYSVIILYTNNNSVIILFTKNFNNNYFFALVLVKKTWKLIKLSHFSSSLCHPFWILVSLKIFPPNSPPK